MKLESLTPGFAFLKLRRNKMDPSGAGRGQGNGWGWITPGVKKRYWKKAGWEGENLAEEGRTGRQTCREGSHAYLSDGRQGG